MVQLIPAARQLSGALTQLGRLAPQLEGFFKGFRKTAIAGRTGFPALQNFIDNELPPFLDEFTPFFKEVTPILVALNRYRREVTAFLGNAAAVTNGEQQSGETNGIVAKYLRTMSPLNAESLAAYPDNRLAVNRTNAYMAPGGYAALNGGLQSFETRQCPGAVSAELNPADEPLFPGDLFDRINLYAFDNTLDTANPAYPKPACVQQGPQQSIGAIPELTQYPHVWANP
jgi:hypothetical protein